MNTYTAFLSKELTEYVRTYKWLIMLIVFFVFGMLSPLTAKLLPEIMASVMTEGFTITIPEPTAIDSWAQFFKNISQMGLIVTVILFSGIVSTEISKGTLINMLTKGMKRSTVILAKFTAMSIVWTVSYLAAFLVCWGYTAYLFPNGALVNLLFSVFCLWLWGIFLLAVLLFGSTLVKNNFGALLLAGVAVVLLTLLNIPTALQNYNPLSLSEKNVALLTNATLAPDLIWAVVIAAAASLLLVFASVAVFKKRQL